MARTSVITEKNSVRIKSVESCRLLTSLITVVNYIVFYLNNIFQTFGHRELVVLVDNGDGEHLFKFKLQFLGNCACVINIT